MRGEATAWIPVLEANQGTLSLLALIATLVLAYMEFRRAKASESAAREAIKRGKEAQWPMAQISGAAIPSASLLIAMNLAVEAIDGLSQDIWPKMLSDARKPARADCSASPRPERALIPSRKNTAAEPIYECVRCGLQRLELA